MSNNKQIAQLQECRVARQSASKPCKIIIYKMKIFPLFKSVKILVIST